MSFDSEEFATITKEPNDFQVILRVSGKNRMSKIMLFASVDEYEQEVNSIKEAYRKKGIDFKLKSEIFSMQKRRSSDSKMESFISDKLFGDEI